MNYYQPSTNRVFTRKYMDMMGLPVDDKVLASLGYFPVNYAYPSVDADLEGFLPDGGIQLEHGVYTQEFKVVPHDEDMLRASLSRIALRKANEARAAADAAVEPYMSEFSDVERQTWPQQQEEVRAYLADSSAPTPTLDKLAEARGISRELMLEKAIAKVTTFEPVAVAVIGRQQAYEDTIKTIANDTSLSLVERIKKLRALSTQQDFPDVDKLTVGNN